jgi:hypothetical protein
MYKIIAVISSWIRSRSEIFGVSKTILGLLASIIGIGEFIYWQRGYIPDTPMNRILVLFTIFNFVVMILFAYRSFVIKNKAKQTISDLWNFIYDLSEYPYNDGRAFDRQLNLGIRAAIAKNGKIPRDHKALITRLNEKDIKLSERFEAIEQDLKENGFI